MFDPAPFLQIALLELGTFFAFQTQAGFPKRCVNFLADLSAVNSFTLAHYSSFVRTHLHPTLGVSLKDLAILGRHGHEALAGIIKSRRPVRRRHRSAAGTFLATGLSRCDQRPSHYKNRNRDRAYKV